jgi:hypothetical protein
VRPGVVELRLLFREWSDQRGDRNDGGELVGRNPFLWSVYE